MDLEIRRAKTDDVPTVRDVARRAWQTAHRPIIGAEAVEEFLSEYYDADTFRTKIRDEHAIFAVAEVESDRIAGFVLAGPTNEQATTYGLSRIYVTPDDWGNGIGRALLAYAEQRVNDRGGERIRLGVMAENERAVDFYEKAGYDKIDTFYDERIDTDGYRFEKVL